MEKWIKQCKLVQIRQVDICKKKKSIIDGAVQVESLLITDNMNSKVVSFLKESSRSKRLHIDGTDFITNCKGWKKFLKLQLQVKCNNISIVKYSINVFN